MNLIVESHSIQFSFQSLKLSIFSLMRNVKTDEKHLKTDGDCFKTRFLTVSDHLKVVRERDNLGKQLLRRNDERVLLYEKIRIQQSILSKGDFHYHQQMDDIRLLKLEIKRLQRKKSILDKTVTNTEQLR